MATLQRRDDEEAMMPAPAEIVSSRPVTRRAFLLGLILSLAMCAVMPYNDYYVGATYLSGNFFPIGAIGAVLALTLLVNPLLITLGRRSAIFRRTEIMTVWSMILVVAGIPSSGLMRYLIPHIVAPHYYATPSNGWEGTLLSRLPSRLLVSDPNAVHYFFEGLPRGGSIPWYAWGVPLFWWGIFVALLFTMFFCMSALLRRQWVEHEHFTFPLVQLPIQISEEPEPGQKLNTLLRSRLLWMGVFAVTAIHTTKGIHLFYPTMPDITLSWHSSDYLKNPPWSYVNDIPFNIFPLVIGFTYLLPLEVSASLWFFFLAYHAETMIAYMFNLDTTGAVGGICLGPGFGSYQEAGGALMACGWLLYGMRNHLRDVWRRAIHGARDIDDEREPLSFRTALFGFALAYVGMFAWLLWVANVSAMMALAVVLGSFVVFLMLSWLVAQAGLLFAQQAFLPSAIVTLLHGGAGLTPSTLTMGAMTEHIGWFDAREFMMPSLLNSFKGASETGPSARSLTKALVTCVTLCVLVSAVASIWLPYTHGGGTALKNTWMYVDAPQLPLTDAAGQVRSPHPAQPMVLAHMAAGAAFVAALFYCRAHFPGFMIHPAGFLVAATYPLWAMWFSILLGWLFKGPIMRYGGTAAYRRLLPLFLGLIVGDCLNAIVWTIIGLVTHTGYSLLPG